MASEYASSPVAQAGTQTWAASEIFHFALLPEGRLFLGVSESAEDVSVLFSVVDKR